MFRSYLGQYNVKIAVCMQDELRCDIELLNVLCLGITAPVMHLRKVVKAHRYGLMYYTYYISELLVSKIIFNFAMFP